LCEGGCTGDLRMRLVMALSRKVVVSNYDRWRPGGTAGEPWIPRGPRRTPGQGHAASECPLLRDSRHTESDRVREGRSRIRRRGPARRGRTPEIAWVDLRLWRPAWGSCKLLPPACGGQTEERDGLDGTAMRFGCGTSERRAGTRRGADAPVAPMSEDAGVAGAVHVSAEAGSRGTGRTVGSRLGPEGSPPGRVAEVSLESDLAADLGMDSLASVELYDRLERTFAVVLPVESLATATTPGDWLRAVLEARTTAPATGTEDLHAQPLTPRASGEAWPREAEDDHRGACLACRAPPGRDDDPTPDLRPGSRGGALVSNAGTPGRGGRGGLLARASAVATALP